MRILAKVLVFSIVSYMTWMATTTIVAQQEARRKSRAPSPPHTRTIMETATTRVSTSEFNPESAPPPIKLGVSEALAEGHLRSSNIGVEDGVATVTAHVSLADQRPGMLYVWRLRVVDPQSNPLAGRLYDQQMFGVEANGQREVHFADTVRVPPGSRRVELVLYEKPPGSDLSFLDDNDTARRQEVIRVVKLLN